MSPTKRITTGILIICLAFSLSSCGVKQPESASVSGVYFDTVISITLYGENAETVAGKCLETAAYYDRLFNRSTEGSDIYRLNSSHTEKIEISEETAKLLSFSLEMSAKSGGELDPVIGALSSLWDFKTEEPVLPGDDAIKEALKHTDAKYLELSGNSAVLTDPDARIDIGAVAKGYIADRIKETALSEGIESGIINLGGNVLTIGSKPDGKPFRVGIKDPFSETGDPVTVLEISDLSVVTSGCYERYFEYKGTLYHHILDKKTGYPVRNNLLSVSVIGPSSAVCDALSTILYIKGEENGLEFIKLFEGYECVFVRDDKSIVTSY